MAFKLSTIRDNRSSVFTIRKILELLGESINDEINIDGRPYRISSFVDLGSSGNSGQAPLWFNLEVAILQNAQTSFELGQELMSFDAVELYINGILYSYGIAQSYHISQGILYWHGVFDLETSDHMLLKYSKSI